MFYMHMCVGVKADVCTVFVCMLMNRCHLSFSQESLCTDIDSICCWNTCRHNDLQGSALDGTKGIFEGENEINTKKKISNIKVKQEFANCIM